MQTQERGTDRRGAIAALQRAAARRPRATIAAALLLSSALAPGLARLELGTDGRALAPPGAPEVLADAAVRELHDLRDPLAVVLESRSPEGIYEPALLLRLVELSASLARLEGVRPSDVQGLATERSDRVRPGTLDFRPWLDPLPRSEGELQTLRRDLEETEIYAGTLLSGERPATATAILVGVPPEVDRAAFGIIALSSVPANARLGGLMLLSVAASFAASTIGLILLPGRRDRAAAGRAGLRARSARGVARVAS